jgi:O-antigen ligase
VARVSSERLIWIGGWRTGAFSVLVCAVLCLALIAGGSSANAVSAGVVRIASVPILAIGLWRLFHRPVSPGVFWWLMIIAAIAVFVLIQMAPLPPDVWSALPGRNTVLGGYVEAGMAPPWLPISLAPWRTEDAILGLIPPVAMFCAVATLEAPARRTLALAVMALAVVSIGLGVMQIVGGADSPLRLYAFTNRDSAVGFFANRNHQAAFLAATLPLVPFLLTWMHPGESMRNVFWLAAAGGFFLILTLGAAITGSRAGAALLFVGFLGAVGVTFRTGRLRWRPASIFVVAAALAASLIVVFGNSVLIERLRDNISEDGRLQIGPVVARAGAAFAPLGSGAGSFADVYKTLERPQMVTPAYINHAHDDYLELWMECGWAAPALVIAFLAWWSAAAVTAVRRRPSEMAALQAAGALIVAMFLLHSIVDYPLRTPALATLFGLACALMLRAPTTGPAHQGSLRARKSHPRLTAGGPRRALADVD